MEKIKIALLTFVAFALFSSVTMASSFDYWSNNNKAMTRYRYQHNTTKKETINDLQYHLTLSGGVGFFEKRFRLVGDALTGSSFQGSFNHSGLGRNKSKTDFHVRRLYADADFMNSAEYLLTLSVGSMSHVYGVGNQMNTFDADGWVSGYRLTSDWKSAKFVATVGGIKKTTIPSFFERTKEMTEFNFAQGVYSRKMSDMTDLSVGYTYWKVFHYPMLAFNYKLAADSFVDNVFFENTYQKGGKNGNMFQLGVGKGMTLFGEKLKTELSYFHRTQQYNLLSGDPVNNEFKGHSALIKLTDPELYKSEYIKLNAFVQHMQNISDFDEYRSEIGLALLF